MNLRLAFFIATFFKIGYSKIAPGTMGSLATLPVAFGLAYYYGFCGIIGGVLIASVLGILSIGKVLTQTPHDPSFVVIDEVAGQLLTFALLANHLQNRSDTWLIYLCGFILFRFFDIFKPQPVGWADRKIRNAWGVMLDDIFAGAYAMVILYLLFVFNIIN